MKIRFTFLFIIAVLLGTGSVFSQNRTLSSQTDPKNDALLKLAEFYHIQYLIRRSAVEKAAKENGWNIRRENPDGVSEIQFIDDYGFPQTYTTTNLNAGKTTNTDDIWTGGSTGLNLTGAGYVVGVWDGGGVLTTHQEFDNGGGTRVTQKDVPSATHWHSTHVAGTIMAEGQDAAAHGMATQAMLHAYEWTDDQTEMATAAAQGLTLSSHSYGFIRGWYTEGGNWYWYGNTTISATEDFQFGFYDATSQAWDNIAFNAPGYLIVKSAGNDRGDSHTGGHYISNGTSWVYSTASRDMDGGADGYDCIEQRAAAKNILTIGAVNPIPGGWSSPADVVMSSFSGWGPTDDGRIKPDLVADGVGVYSTSNSSNSSYTSASGTSMSTPNTTGTLVLLQDYYKSLHGGTMSAAALKGLVINTANEAGPNSGPDYMNGWGLLNASGAANLITADNSNGGLIVQSMLANGQTIDYTYYSDGSSPVNVTLCWTDPAGTPVANSLNPANLMLVNDLDVRVIGTLTNYPWMLNPSLPSAAATKGDNFRDNVETVNLASPTAGYYTVRVSHSGVLTGGLQAYALIIKGMRTPPVLNYCGAGSTVWQAWEYISHVSLGSISHFSGRSPGGYGDFTGMSDTFNKTTSQTLSVTINGYSGDQCKAWIDWNQDGYFTGPGEEYLLGSGAGSVFSQVITAPVTATTGYTTMRVRLNYSSAPACGTSTYGETEDYTIKVMQGCEAGGGCDEHISRVQAGTIDNSTACNNYTDYTATQSTSLPVNGIIHATITNGNPVYPSDQCAIWVDWNRNGSFYDADEQVAVSGTPGVGPYSAAIVPPAGQTSGNCIMRVRIGYIGVLDPCGTTTYGEVEDYALNLTAKAANVWTGNFSNYWNNSANWSLEHVPAADEEVVIPNVNMPCIVDFTAATCNSLTTWAGSTLKVHSNTLTVNGNLDIYGQLAMDHASGVLNVMGNIYWENGSTANISAASLMWIYGDWEFRAGSNVQLASGYVDFTGTSTRYLRNYSPYSSFNNVGIYKSGGAFLTLSYESTCDLTINGYLGIQPGAFFNGGSTYSLFLKGSLFNSSHIIFYYGTLVMNGAYQTLKLNAGDFLNNLTISSTGTTNVDNSFSDTLTIKGNLVIESGVFDPMNHVVQIAGNWTNLAGDAGFTEGASRVVFNGSGHQYVLSGEKFNILEAAMGAALRVNNAASNVVCNQYIHRTGGIDVIAGTFTALDLAQNGIFGGYWLNPGGTINLYNNDGYVDMNGNLNIYGGNFNVYGGAGSDSYWPYVYHGGITMTGGTLDFKNVGVYVNPTLNYSFAENITSGTIRSSRGFVVARSDYTPDGGTVELYGSADGNFSTSNGGYVRNLIVNKNQADNGTSGSCALVRNRETSATAYAPLSNTIICLSGSDVKGNVTIQSGILSAGSSTINVDGNWDNQAGTGGFAEGIGEVRFTGAQDADILSNETFYNLTVLKTSASETALELASGLSVFVTNDLAIYDGLFELNASTTLDVDRHVSIVNGAGLNANDAPVIKINVGGNWTNSNANYSLVNGFDPGVYSTVTFNGFGEQYLLTACAREDFFNLVIDKAAGRFRPQDNLQTFNDILISNGIWEDFTLGLTHNLFRNFIVLPSGSFLNEFPLNTVEFTGTLNSVLSYTGASGSFHHLLINKTTGYSVTQAGTAGCRNDGNLTVENGIYSLNGNTMMVSGNVTVNDAAVLRMPSASLLTLTDSKSLNVNTGGRLEIAGTSVSPATIRADLPAAGYAFNVNSGGTIAADYTVFRNISGLGVNVLSDGLIDPAHAFEGCTFQDGLPGGSLLTISNSQVITIRNAVFPANTWSGSSNVYKSINAGHVYFADYSGGFSGESFDNDLYNRIDWIPVMTAAATASPTAVCPGSSTQLNITQTGGLAPFTYLWSPAAGLSDPAIINPMATLQSTTVYSVLVTDALGTTTTGNVTVIVNPTLQAGVSIAASANPSPPGTWVTFTATPWNGGTIPSYQWKINGVNSGTGLPTLSYIPSYNDQVRCAMTSSYACSSGNPATSNVINMVVVATSSTATGTIPAPLTICIDAINTITVAGGGSTFLVQSGASATMIAGMKILYLPGARALSGSYMHGYITRTNSYCGSQAPAIMAVATGTSELQEFPETSGFSLYPNPTTGKFTLFQKGEHPDGVVKVEIISMRGERLHSELLVNERKHEFNISDLAAGLYFVRVYKADQAETFKLVITR